MPDPDRIVVMYGSPETLFHKRERADKQLHKHIEVVAAILIDDNAVLATQRGYGDWKGWWEFPGGKIQPGESHEQALVRELHEEMDADIVIDRNLTTIEYDYPDFHLTMHCYLCHLTDGHYTLKEHLAAHWLTAETLQTVQWLPADEELVQNLSSIL